MMFRNSGWVVAGVVALCALTAAGCNRRSSSSRGGGGSSGSSSSPIFSGDTFPGTPASAFYTADDGLALSPASAEFGGGLKVTFNGDRSAAMITYIVAADGDVYYGQYYHDSTFTPPIRISAVDYDPSTNVAVGNATVHGFINTEGTTLSEAADRDGDCLIIWQAKDIDAGAAGDDVNTCLFVTYFDVTHSDDPSFRYGFQEFATRISVQDEDTEDVMAFGLVTDGLRGEARFSDEVNDYVYGDATTAFQVVWVQRENNDGVAGFDDQALHTVRFDPAEAIDSDLPLTPGADTRMSMLAFAASDTGTSSEETQVDDTLLVTYNNVVLYRAAADNSTLGDDAVAFTPFGAPMGASDDITIQGIAFSLSTGASSAPFNLGGFPIVATDTIESHAFFLARDGNLLARNSVYGSDEGLSALVVYFCELVGDLDGEVDFGDAVNDSRLAIAEFDEALGTPLQQGFLDIEDADITDPVNPAQVDTAISRNGDYIWAAWLELEDSGTTDEVALWVNQLQTTRIADNGDFPLPDTLANTTSGAIAASVDVDGEPVNWFAFQNGLRYICGAQSDPDVMNVFVEQSAGADDEIDAIRLVADVDVNPADCVPTTTVSVLEVFENGDQPGSGFVNTENRFFAASDLGDGGNWFAAYRKDIDVTPTDDMRLFAERDGTAPATLEIDSNVDFRQIFDENLIIIGTPPGSDIGVFNSDDDEDSDDRAHGNEIVHVFFVEDQSTEFDGSDSGAIRTRAYYTEDEDAAFGDNFSPNVGTPPDPPFTLNRPFESSTSFDGTFEILGTAVEDNTVGIWFADSDHIYYQEFHAATPNSIGWHVEGSLMDVSDPFLVDDETDTDFEFAVGAFINPGVCNNLDDAMVFWATFTDDDHDNERLRVRVRDGESD